MPSLLLALLLAGDLAAAPSAVPGMSPVRGLPNLLQSGIPEVPPALRVRVRQFLEARGARLLDVTDDGGAVLIATRFASVPQLHLVSMPLGMREQLTFGDEPVLAARFRPGDPATVLYLQDTGGGEQYQLHRLDRRTGRSQLLTDGKSRHERFVLSRDGGRVAYSSTQRNGKDTDVWVMELDRPESARLLVEAEGSVFPADFSPDGGRLLVSQFRSIADGELRLVEVASGAARPLTPKEGKGSVRAAAFTADGEGVLLVTDRHGENNELYLLDPARPEAAPRPLTRAIRWDVEEVEVARDGSRVAVSVNAGGVSRVWLVDPRRGGAEPVELAQGVAGALRFPARRPGALFVGLESARAPFDVFQADLAARKVVRWTRSELGGLDPAGFADARLVQYPSTDGVTVPAFLFRPPARFTGPRPVVIAWHGGPEAQSRPVFSPFLQILVTELGYAVLLPNVRGSDGYGKAFLARDDGVKREQVLADIGATLDWVAGQKDLDAARVAVYGGSYGGYMVLATLAFFPGRVRAGVDVVGISSIPAFLDHTSPYRRDLRRAEYGDERDPAVRAVQERISPLGSVEKIDASLLVVQGKNDPRVPQSEAEQIVKAVRAKGKEVWYLLALDEGHGFAKKANRDFQTEATVMFLERELGGAGPGSGSGR